MEQPSGSICREASDSCKDRSATQNGWRFLRLWGESLVECRELPRVLVLSWDSRLASPGLKLYYQNCPLGRLMKSSRNWGCESSPLKMDVFPARFIRDPGRKGKPIARTGITRGIHAEPASIPTGGYGHLRGTGVRGEESIIDCSKSPEVFS